MVSLNTWGLAASPEDGYRAHKDGRRAHKAGGETEPSRELGPFPGIHKPMGFHPGNQEPRVKREVDTRRHTVAGGHAKCWALYRYY